MEEKDELHFFQKLVFSLEHRISTGLRLLGKVVMPVGHYPAIRGPLTGQKNLGKGHPDLTEKKGSEGLRQPRYPGAARTSR